jgi:hypothetical protein
MSELRRRFSSIKPAGTGFVGNPFFRRSEVADILTIEDIRSCLSSYPTLRDKERDVHRFASLIRQSCLRIFAILLYDRNELYVLEFIFRRDTDDRLPYGPDSLYYLPEEVAEQFVTRQWQFDPVILKRDTIHRELHPKAIIPFISEKKIGEGSFGTVWEATLDSHCQELIPQSTGEVSTGAKMACRREI